MASEQGHWITKEGRKIFISDDPIEKQYREIAEQERQYVKLNENLPGYEKYQADIDKLSLDKEFSRLVPSKSYLFNASDMYSSTEELRQAGFKAVGDFSLSSLLRKDAIIARDFDPISNKTKYYLWDKDFKHWTKMAEQTNKPVQYNSQDLYNDKIQLPGDKQAQEPQLYLMGYYAPGSDYPEYEEVWATSEAEAYKKFREMYPKIKRPFIKLW